MESSMNQGKEEKKEKQTLFERFPFLKYLKGRLVDYVDPDTGRRYTGHVAMFYRDTSRIRIDWDNGAQTYHDFTKDSKWVFKAISIRKKKKVESGSERN